jgi:hypothetical protein
MELQPHNSLGPALCSSLASALTQGPPGRHIWVPAMRDRHCGGSLRQSPPGFLGKTKGNGEFCYGLGAGIWTPVLGTLWNWVRVSFRKQTEG